MFFDRSYYRVEHVSTRTSGTGREHVRSFGD